MATKTKKKSEKGNEILESSEALAEQLTRGEQFIEKNRKLLFIVGGALALIVAGFFLFKYYKTSQNQRASAEMFQAQYYFEQDSLSKALNGDGNNYGFLDIIEEYPMTEAANLSRFYAGSIYLAQGDYENAIKYLQEFSADDLLLQPRAYSLIGDAYMEQGLYADAAKQYEKAAEYKPNEFTTPLYLDKAAIAYERTGNLAAAIETYNIIIENYETSAEYQNAVKQKARLTGKMKSE